MAAVVITHKDLVYMQCIWNSECQKKKSKKFSLAHDTSVHTTGLGVGDILEMRLFFQIKVTASGNN